MSATEQRRSLNGPSPEMGGSAVWLPRLALTACVLFSGFLPMHASALTGKLDRVSPTTMVVDGESYPVARDARLVPQTHRLFHRKIYNLTEKDLASLPEYSYHRLRATARVEIRLDNERVKVVRPLEYKQ